MERKRNRNYLQLELLTKDCDNLGMIVIISMCSYCSVLIESIENIDLMVVKHLFDLKNNNNWEKN